jgi:hypothetical protein
VLRRASAPFDPSGTGDWSSTLRVSGSVIPVIDDSKGEG